MKGIIDMEVKNMNFADITSKDVENLNGMQNQIKTKDGKDVILLAYEK
ncbi:hypothetical protein [Aminipila terrae]|uniref:Uncharacterized protein n=1 Tax=Aminipila terrae TaxID=2697030 RepID=A0A6P1MG43_9FIRM|nr:hypothetical protein [Aminipila terrae]QHI72153.1 hypothetical protein Ami3637_06830 [Aminipila terrae]